MNYRVARHHLEWLHLKYLLRHFNLSMKSLDKGWDLYSDHDNFELKSRLYYVERHLKNMWFLVTDRQYLDYKQHSDKDIYWIFIASVPLKPVRKVKYITEDFILHRDIYFVHWDIVQRFPLGKAKEHSKLGPGRNVSTNHLKRMLKFDEYDLPKARVYMERGEHLDYLFSRKL